MLPERFKAMFRSPGAQQSPSKPRGSQHERETVNVRHSRALEQFFNYINDQAGLSILDLAAATQENVTFVTGLGHKLYTQDFLRSLDDTFGSEDIVEQSNARRIELFLQQNLDYADQSFDAVLMWDVLQYLSPALMNATVKRLREIVRPNSYLLGFFNADEKNALCPETVFRIQNISTVELTQRGHRKNSQVFNNRSLEKVFAEYSSVKFFLTRENFREIIVKR